MTRPSIDHGILSGLGKLSKRSRKIIMERERNKLFPPGYWEELQAEAMANRQPSEKERLLRQAKELRELASRGMKPRAYAKKADELEAQARELE